MSNRNLIESGNMNQLEQAFYRSFQKRAEEAGIYEDILNFSTPEVRINDVIQKPSREGMHLGASTGGAIGGAGGAALGGLGGAGIGALVDLLRNADVEEEEEKSDRGKYVGGGLGALLGAALGGSGMGGAISNANWEAGEGVGRGKGINEVIKQLEEFTKNPALVKEILTKQNK